MPIAAVPEYLGQDFKEASPGMRFGMYLRLWGENRELKKNDWRTCDRIWNAQKKKPGWEDSENKVLALTEAGRLESGDKTRMVALSKRQSALAQALGGADQLLTLEAKSVAPFTTGLGNEHPLENGFSFLWPYGLPYLPGSGVKGVLRQAARELASGTWGEDAEWTQEVIAALFGSEDSDNARRGALTFWDVIPQIAGELMVEVMTGHQSHYYMKGQSPHDSGQPIPVYFLTVPPGSGFTFHVVCDRPFLQRIAPNLAENDRWKSLLQQAFEHAFAWLGFGAKTAVGYGAMEEDPKAVARRRQEEEERRRKEEERRKAEEEARRRAEEARRQEEEARRRAEALEAMPHHRRAMAEAEERLVGLRRQMTIADQSVYGGLRSLVKELLAAAEDWGASEREELGTWLQQTLDSIEHGWRHPDQTSKQRKKWEKKHRDAIERLKGNG